jgi:hypothetical protein
MRIRVKINKTTGVAYIPKALVEDGFNGDTDLFGYGSVLVIIRPGTDTQTVIDCLGAIGKEVQTNPSLKKA